MAVTVRLVFALKVPPPVTVPPAAGLADRAMVYWVGVGGGSSGIYVETVTVQDALYPPSAVVAVITAVPLPTAVTLPFWSTVATAVFPLTHVTALLVALAGETVAVSASFRIKHFYDCRKLNATECHAFF